MKTAISIEDKLFAAGEEEAKLLKMSRSELYSTALRAFLKERRDRAITEAINRVCDDPASADPETEALVVSAGKRTFARSEW